MSHAAPDTEFIPFVSTAPALRWKANHSRGWHAVEGGWAAVRVLVGAIDGDWWPWTQIERTDSFRWFQVLGTPDRCILELGQDGHVAMVYRADHGGPSGWLGLPSACAWWISAVRSDEALTADEAASVGQRWLLGQEPWGAWGTRPPYPSQRMS